MNEPGPVKRGDRLRADWWNLLAGMATGRHVQVQPPLTLEPTSEGQALGMNAARPIFGQLTGASSPYSWTQVKRNGTTHAWASVPHALTGSANAYELNSIANLAGKVVPLYKAGKLDWLFRYNRVKVPASPLNPECCFPVESPGNVFLSLTFTGGSVSGIPLGRVSSSPTGVCSGGTAFKWTSGPVGGAGLSITGYPAPSAGNACCTFGFDCIGPTRHYFEFCCNTVGPGLRPSAILCHMIEVNNFGTGGSTTCQSTWPCTVASNDGTSTCTPWYLHFSTFSQNGCHMYTTTPDLTATITP